MAFQQLRLDNNISPRCELWEEIAEALGCEEITEDDLWERARECENLPIMGNLYMDMLLSQIIENCESFFGIELTTFINSIDTHLYLNGEEVTDKDKFFIECLKYAHSTGHITIESEDDLEELIDQEFKSGLSVDYVMEQLGIKFNE
jgi:hypothetical protein